MKTKTNSFTKVINFCVLALFLITNMIFFTSCDNGNSPNDKNEEQNNTQNTDYCEICDGLQTENCGIKHKCDDENCVEYSDNRIYKNGHTHDYCNEDGCLLDDSVRHTTHDYCLEDDCDGSTHMGQAHPTDTSWFKETPIGGEDSPYKVFVIDNNAYNETNDFTAKEKINDYLDKYIEHINGLTLNKELTGEIEIPTTAIKNMAGDNAEWRFDALIGTTSKNEISTNTIGINDVCKPAIEKIINNVGSGDTAAVDKAYFAIYYKAIANEAYRNGYNGEFTTKNQNGTYDTNDTNQMKNQYNKEKNKCIELCGGDEYLPFENKYFYDETGKINLEVLKQFDDMIITVAENLSNSGTNVTPTDLRNIINLSLTASSIEGMHDYLSSTLLVNEHTHTDACYNNEMYDKVIEPIAFPTLTKAPTKLNKSIFSHDYGRELV